MGVDKPPSTLYSGDEGSKDPNSPDLPDTVWRANTTLHTPEREVMSDILLQLLDPTIDSWVSDGSMSKLVYGKLVCIHMTPKGIMLILNNGRKVSWRMSQKKAQEIIDYMKWCFQDDEVKLSASLL